MQNEQALIVARATSPVAAASFFDYCFALMPVIFQSL
jgi:hypothetical protein